MLELILIVTAIFLSFVGWIFGYKTGYNAAIEVCEELTKKERERLSITPVLDGWKEGKNKKEN
jgi:hypothetical protein